MFSTVIEYTHIITPLSCVVLWVRWNVRAYSVHASVGVRGRECGRSCLTWMSVSNMLNLRCGFLAHAAKQTFGSTNCVIPRFVHAKGTHARDVVNLKLI
jgi:hypothetical protein